MSRLSFTSAAFRQRLRMSKDARIFLVVEGQNLDRWFYDKTLRADSSLKRLGFKIYPAASLARELGERALGGRRGVLAVYDRLRQVKALTFGSGSTKRTVMFCLDADHDRIVNRIRRSPHVTYTQLPDAEAQLLQNCESHALFSALLSLPDSESGAVEKTLGDWRLNYAQACREWFIWCHIAHQFPNRGMPQADTPPQLTKRHPVTLNQTKLAKLRQSITATIGSNSQLAIAEKLATDRIDQLLRNGRHSQLLKGKWILPYLADLLNGYAKSNGCEAPSSGPVVLAACKGVADFSNGWAKYFNGRIKRIL